jgi:hypothetical protein
VDTGVSVQHAASIFRAEVCRVNSWLGYTGAWSLGSLGGGKEMESGLCQMGMVGRKMAPGCDKKHSVCVKKTISLPTAPTRPGLHFPTLSYGYQ